MFTLSPAKRLSTLQSTFYVIFCASIFLSLSIGNSLAQDEDENGDDAQHPACMLGMEYLMSTQGDEPVIHGGGDEPPPNLGEIQSMQANQLAIYLDSTEYTQLQSQINWDTDLTADALNNVLLLVIDDYQSPLGRQTHGDYVLQTVIEAYNSIDYGAHITVYPVNFAPDNRIETFINRTEATLDSLVAGDIYDVVIYNMSWVILGCKIEYNVNTSDDTQLVEGNVDQYLRFMRGFPIHKLNFEQYLDSDIDANLIEALNEYGELLLAELEQNPLPVYSLIDYLLLVNATSEVVTPYLQLDEPLTDYSDDDYTGVVRAYIEGLREFISNGPSNVGAENLVRSTLGLSYTSPDEDEQGNDDDQGDELPKCRVDTCFYVAASGNFNIFQGDPLNAFPPASWNDVLAVSGSVTDNWSEMWQRSQDGQLMAPAAWYETRDHDYIAGTSFGTPLVSVISGFLLAIDDCDVVDLIDDVGKEENRHFLQELASTCLNDNNE